MKNKFVMNRRNAIKGLGGAAIGVQLANQRLFADSGSNKKYLFVICASGGANIVDSFLSQATGPAAYTNLVAINGSPFMAVPVLSNTIQGAIPLGNGYAQATFLQKNAADTVVMTCEVSSVNHIIAAKRAMSGDNAFGGRMLPEAIAMQFGKNLLLPNLMLAGGGYASHGDDVTVPDAYRAQFVADPLMFAFATHGYKGISGDMSAQDMRASRELRSQLETVSRFQQQFNGSNILSAYQKNRERIVETLEKGDTVTKLMLLDPTSNNLAQYGFQVSSDIDLVRAKYPNLATDPFEARLALGFLAAKSGLSNAITIAPSPTPLISAQGSPNAPIAFDWSHVDHRGAQNSMWSYVLKGIDGLIDLLKATDVDGDPSQGKMWDRSMIYIATEFGRDKVARGGSGHNLNNGVVMISPMLKGNRIFGGIDSTTGLSYGFDPLSGQVDTKRKMKEKHIYSAISHAMELSYDGRVDFPSMVRKA